MTTIVTANPDYTKAQPELLLVRTFIEGEAAVKRAGYTYLPHPNMLDTKSDEQVRRYQWYKDGAEVEDFPSRTLADLIGAMNRQPIVAELPEKLAYLIEDSDGDWLPLQSSIEITASNCLQVNWHILLAEYDPLPDGAGTDISIAEKEALGQRASIKHYHREAMEDWAFGRVNGRLQLTYVRLESCETRKNDDLTTYEATVRLELGLDELGYWQRQTIVKTASDGIEGEKIYPQASGKTLDFIPIEVVMSERAIPGRLPVSAGYIAPLCHKARHRYMVSADLKERLRILQDTSFSSGWDESKKEQFTAINGRPYFAFGAGVHNFLPQDVEMDILKMTADGDALFRYMEENAKQIRAIGGRYDTDDKGQETLGEVEIKDSKEKAVLTILTNNIERAYKRLICYCGLFEGLALEPDEIDLKLNREFTSTKLSPEEIKAIIELRLSGLLTLEQTIKKLVAGGYLEGEAEELLAELENEGPAPAKEPVATKEEA